MSLVQENDKVELVRVGDVVRVVSESYEPAIALVTAVHGKFPEEQEGETPGGKFIPCLNVVFVSADESKRDPYGRQVERMSSLQHYSQGPNEMPRPGRYWVNY